MFGPQDVTCDGFLGGRLQILQPRTGYRAATDPVLLAAAVTARPGQTVLELGCGAGVASLCLGARVPGLALCGVEVQPDYAALARQNAARNTVALEVVDADLAALPSGVRARQFDHVMLNPPYYPAQGGTPAADPGRERALREALPLADWIRVALARTRPGGWLTLIQAADRLGDVLAGLRGSVTVLPLVPRTGRAAHRVIVRAKKDGRAPLVLLSPLVMHEGVAHLHDGCDLSAPARAVLRLGAALPWHA